MSFIPVTLTNLQQMLQNDAQQMRTFLDWLEDRDSAYGQAGLTGAFMTGLGISSVDQNNVLALVYAFNRINAYVQGNVQSIAAIIRVDVNNILGVM